MYTNDEYKALLENELYSLKNHGQLKRWSTTYNAMTGKFDIWYEFPDGHATTFTNILTVDDLRLALGSCLPCKKSWKCHICRYYLKNSDGCKKGFYNSIFIPCPDWKGPENQPSDKDLCKCLDILISESAQMTEPMEMIHKGIDWIVCFMLKLLGYSEGLKSFDSLPKGYLKDIDEAVNCEEPIVLWQCMLCQNHIWKEQHCKYGLDEGWERNNKCGSFCHISNQINPKMFIYMMDMIYNEKIEAEVSYECIHMNMDRLMWYVLRSLGYFDFIKKVQKLDLEYLDVPF